MISYFSAVPQATVISPKFRGRDEWVGLYTDSAAVGAGTAETGTVFVIVVGSGDGMCLGPVAAVGLHITEHKAVL